MQAIIHVTSRLGLALLLSAPRVLAQQNDLTTPSNAAHFRGQEGRRITVVCPPQFTAGSVWGTDVYTDDSSICGAAAHSGALRAAEGGVVTAVITTGRQEYKGSTRNGVTSADYEGWGGSFTIANGDGGQIDWKVRAYGIENLKSPITLNCPPGEIGGATIWGTGVYTDDTPICPAAVHAGVISASQGGRVVIRYAGSRTSYGTSNRNGVTSVAYGSWPRSFSFEGGIAEEVATAQTPSVPITREPSATVTRQRSAAGAAPRSPKTAPLSTPSRTNAPIAAAAPELQAPPSAASISSHRAAKGSSPVSSRIAATNDPAAVHATDFTALAGYGMNVLSWKAAPGAIGYRLARATWDPARLAFIQGSDVTIPTPRMIGESDLIRETTYTDHAVVPGTQYVYWLDTNFKTSDGQFYFATTSPWPSATVTPRDPAGLGWLPADWQSAPELIRAEIVSQSPGGISTANVKVEWRPKGGAVGYIVSLYVASSVSSRPAPGCPSKPARPVSVLPSLPGAWYITLAHSATQRIQVELSSIYVQSGVMDLSPWGCVQVVAVYPNKLDPGTGTPTVKDAFMTEISGPGPESRFKVLPGAIVSKPASAGFYAPSLLEKWEYIAP